MLFYALSSRHAERIWTPFNNIERFHGIVFSSKSNVTLIKKDPTSTSHLWSKILSHLRDFFAQLVTKVLTHPAGPTKCSNQGANGFQHESFFSNDPAKIWKPIFQPKKHSSHPLKQIEKWQMVWKHFGHLGTL